MPTIRNFEELDIWKNARKVTKQVYEDFRVSRDFGYRDQIQRASVSIMNNIAEGFCRQSKREMINFCIAKGSAAEVKSMYYIADDLSYLPSTACNERRIAIQRLINGISAFMHYLANDNSK